MYLGNTALRKIALDENFKIDRCKNEIVLYKAWHNNGFVTLYMNKSANKVLTELVEYNLQGMQIEGLEGDKQVFVNVGPGEEHLIKLVNTGSCEERKLQCTILQKKITYIDNDETITQSEV